MSRAGFTRSQTGLHFFPSSHRYKLDGKWVPGVTTILGVLDKPALPKWSAGEVAAYVADNPKGVEELRGLGRDPMVAALKGIPWAKRDTAADRGNVLHDYAEQLLHGQEVDIDEAHVPVMENALRFMDDWHIEPLLIEFPVASREHQWAGTGDLIAHYRHPVTKADGIGVFDWKSGKRLYPEHAWQFAAYGHAEFTGTGGDEKPLPECNAAYGVYIRPDGYDVAPFNYGPDIYAEFLAIRRVYDIAKAGRGDWRTPGSGHMGLLIQPSED